MMVVGGRATAAGAEVAAKVALVEVVPWVVEVEAAAVAEVACSVARDDAQRGCGACPNRREAV